MLLEREAAGTQFSLGKGRIFVEQFNFTLARATRR